MDLNKKKFQSVLGVVLAGVAFYWGLNNLGTFAEWMKRILGMLMPFILGASIAFVINIPVRMIEEFLIKKKWGPQKYARAISLIITIILFLLALVLLVLFVIPELARSFNILFEQLPEAFESTQNFFTSLMDKYPNYKGIIESLEIDYGSLSSGILDFVQNIAKSLMGSALDIMNSVVNGTASFVIGLTFSFYIIFQKETLGIQTRKLFYAFLPENVADYILGVAKLSSTTFNNFFAGQGIEMIILGVIFFVSMTIFRMPYAMLISVIIAITSIVPIFGPMFASFIGVFLILLVDPWMALWFFIMFQVIQQIEGNFIYPQVVGKSVGLPSIWVLFSLTIGGKIMGLVGMIISIPVFSIIYVLLKDIVQRQLEKRNIKKEKLEPHSETEA